MGRKNCKPFIQLISYLIIILLLNLPLSAWAEKTPKIELTPGERAWLAENHDIRVTFSEHPPYFSFKDGGVAGIAVDILNRISEDTGVKFQYADKPYLFADELSGLIDHKGPDLVSAIMPTPVREKVILFTEAYINSPRFIFTRDDATFVSSIENLSGQKVAVVKDYVTHKYLAKNYPNIILSVFSTNEEALRAVSTGEAFAFIGDLISIPSMINKFGLKNLKASSPSGLPDHTLAIGVRNDWPELRNILDKALEAIPAAEKAAIINKWSTVKIEHGIRFGDVMKWGLILFVSTSGIILLFAVWNKQLSGKVKERTSELIETESRFRATFEQAAVGIAHVSLEGKFLRVNEKFCEIIGYSEEEMWELTFQDITHPDDLEADLESVQQLLNGARENYSMDKRYYHKDGSVVWVNLTVSLVFDKGGQAKYFVSVIKDISDRKQAEEALQQNLDFLEHLTSSVPDAIYSIKMPERTVIWGNDSFNVLGYEPAECIGHSVKMFYADPEDYYVVGDLQKDAIRKGDNMISTEVMVRRKDGRVVPVELTATFFREKGKLSTITAMTRDITERKQAVEELHYQSRLLKNVSDAIVSTDRDHKVVSWNEAAERIYGWNVEEALGLVFRELTDIKYPDGSRDEMFSLVEQEGFWRGELNQLRKDGKRMYVQAMISAIIDDKGNPVGTVGVMRDITQSKQDEEKLLESEEKFRTLVTDNEEIIYIIDKNGTFTLSEGKGLSVLGLQPGQVVGKSVFELYKDYPQILDSVRKALNGETITTEINVEGNYFSNWHTPHKNQSGEIIGILGLSVNITARKKSEKQLQEAYENIEQLQKQLQAESAYLQEEIRLEHNFENIIGQSEALTYVLHRVELVAPQDTTVLVMGETGTGKELIARALHQLSSRNKRPLVKVNCAALPGELIESELFGREKGAYTGATTTQVGRFELAHDSTLFLDEIGELPLALQAKLLRVIESGEFERLGSARTMKSNARIIAATNRDLEEEVRNNRFREDLMYRLNIFPISVPPLRDRLEDIPMLVESFVQFGIRKMGNPAKNIEIPKRSMQALQSYSWPGNVRELKHVIEGALISLQGNKLHFDLPKTADTATSNFKSFEDMEREYILEVLKAKNWKIGGENSASSILGMHPNTLRSRIKKLGLKRP